MTRRPITYAEFMGIGEPRWARPLLVACCFVGLLLCALVLGCSDATATRRALAESGFKDVITTGWAMFGCSDSDGTCTGFIATGPTGVRVEGYVGCGYFFKGCTLRLK